MKRVFPMLTLLILFLWGCNSDASNDRTIQFLQQARAKGKATIAISEHPLQIGQSTHFFAGPNTTITFDGAVDFTDPVEFQAAVREAVRDVLREQFAPAPESPL